MLKLLFTFVFCLGTYISVMAQQTVPMVVGEMRDVMWKGKLKGVIKTDTLSGKAGLYGLGPVEYLKGEILILEGVTYVSGVIDNTAMRVRTNSPVSAPFFAYANIPEWSEVNLPSPVKDLSGLEQFLDEQYSSVDIPFFFKLEGVIDSAEIHIVNLPEGHKVTNPGEAHQGQVNYPVASGHSTLLGFFSRKHKAIFTHHDTFIHIHLITADKASMGHLEKIGFRANNMKLFIPAGLK